MNILLVEPNFPYPNKSKNKANEIHRNFVPIGLLKIGAFYKDMGVTVKLVRGKVGKSEVEFTPTKIFVTSIFTYWSKYVWDTVGYYRQLYPDAEITIGGIYATLHYRRVGFKRNLEKYNAQRHIGLFREAEKFYPDYSLLEKDVDHHVTHAMRGCIRRCSFCGTWRIEPKRYDKPVEELIEEIKSVGKNKVIFFDNNFFAHKNIKNLLGELAKVRVNGHPVSYESQSGFDGRLLQKHPDYATLLKQANFKNIRIAWDSSYVKYRSIKTQLDILEDAGYDPKYIAIFMIYNYDTSFEDMVRKLHKCKEWGVQVNDCRYRPIKVKYDNYNSRKYKKGQTPKDYYIHIKGGWTDKKVRDFRRQVREHNISIRCGHPYSKDMERWSDVHNAFKFFGLNRPPEYQKIITSPTLDRRVMLMKKIRNFLKKHKKMSMNLQGLRMPQIDQLLLETTESLGIQISKN